MRRKFDFFLKVICLFIVTPIGLLSSGQSVKTDREKNYKKNDWEVLFDGKTLHGWAQKNGTATYQVKNGVIIGTTKEGSKNSFLCTKRNYSDFELQLDVKVDTKLNSGIQIRSKTREKSIGSSYNQTKGRVTGPQVEIESSGENGGEAGYIWIEASEYGWMTSTGEMNPKPRKIFKDNKWNHYRIIAKGPQIITWINGELVEDVINEKIYTEFSKGFIGLQVHAVHKGTGPYQVFWRNIKIKKL